MSEKVLGFTKKDANFEQKLYTNRYGEKDAYLIPTDKLVFVRLKSESVSLKALKKAIRKLEKKEEKKLQGDKFKAVEAITYCAAFYDLAREIGMELEDPTEPWWNKRTKSKEAKKK